MSRHRTGRVEARGPNRYIARIGGAYLGTRATEAEAHALIAAAKHVEASIGATRSVRVLGEQWLEKMEHDEQKRRGVENAYTVRTELRGLWKRWVLDSAIIDLDVVQVRRSHIQEIVDNCVGSPRMYWRKSLGRNVETDQVVGKRTGQTLVSVLRRFLASSICKLEHVPNLEDLDFPNVEGVREKFDLDNKTHLHLDEIDRLYALPTHVFTVYHRAVYGLGIYGGLRRGEVAGLRWGDVVELDSVLPEIHVRRSYGATTKTAAGQREIPVLPQLAVALRAYRAGRAPSELHPASLLFPSPRGARSTRGRTWDPQWKDLVDPRPRVATVTPGFRTLAGIRPHVQHRHVRHSCATHLESGAYFASYDAAWPIERIAGMLGHTDVAMTRGHYASGGVKLLRAELERSLRVVAASHESAEAAE